MKKLLLLICLCLCSIIVDAQRTLNWEISFETENLISLPEIRVTVNKTDTCSFIESLFFPSDMYSKTVESEGNIYTIVEHFFMLDILNTFTEAGWNVDDIFYDGAVSGKCEINISLVSIDGSPEGFFNSVNKKRTYMLGANVSDEILLVYPPFVSKAHLRYMDLLKKQYDENNKVYIFDYSILNNIKLMYISGWRIDFFVCEFYDGSKKERFFFSHEYEDPE